MIEIKKVEPKVQNGKKVIVIKNAFVNEDGIICDEYGAVGSQLKPELPSSDATFDFKITFIIEDDVDEFDDLEPPTDADFQGVDNIPTGYDGLNL